MDEMNRQSMKELGKLLEEERIRRGLTLKEVSARTQISVKMLQSLEEGECERIGAPILIRSFLRTYCRVLEVDPEPFLERCDPEIQACVEQVKDSQLLRKLASRTPTRKRAALFITCILVLFGLGGWLLEYWITKRNAQFYTVPKPLAADNSSHDELLSELSKKELAPAPVPEAHETPPSPAAEVPHVPEAGSLTSEGGPVETSRAGNAAAGFQSQEPEAEDDSPVAEVSRPEDGKHHLVIITDQESWIEVRVDGRQTDKALMKPGETREWTAAEGVYIVVGNAGGTRLSWDGKPLALPTKSGRVLRLRLPETPGDEKETQGPSRP
jgi:cytoskeletal protein RodZ